MQCPHCGDTREFWIEAWASLLFKAKDGFALDMQNTELVCPACGKATKINAAEENNAKR